MNTEHKSKAAALKDKHANSADTWCAHGETFGQAAHALFTSGNPFFYFPAALLGHQALEMVLKAALLRQGFKINEAWGHDLVKLANKLTASGKVSLHEEVFEVGRIFNAYFKELRYPQELEDVEGLGEAEGERLNNAIPYVLPYARAPKVRPK